MISMRSIFLRALFRVFSVRPSRSLSLIFCFISEAAALVKVTTRKEPGAAPSRSIRTIRSIITAVFPLPAAAEQMIFPAGEWIASHCCPVHSLME